MKLVFSKMFPVILLLVMVDFAGFASAQDDNRGKICFGWYSLDAHNNRVITGQISNNEPTQELKFTGQAGTFATIQMEVTGGNLEPFLYVTDLTTNRRIASTSGVSFGGRNAATLPFALASNGDYVITATRLGETTGTSSGTYEIALELGASNPIISFDVSRRLIVPQAMQNSLIFDGEAITGGLPLATPASEFAAWHFEGQSGQRINAQLSSINGSQLQGTRLELWAFVDGAWKPQASSEMGEPRFTNQLLSSSGRFALLVSRIAILNYGNTVNGTTREGPGDDWWFYGNSGDNITVRLAATDDTPELILYDSFGSELGTNYASSDSDVVSIEGYSLPTSGIYRIAARSRTRQSNSYALTLTSSNPVLTPVEYSLSLSGSGGIRPELPPCRIEPSQCPALSPLNVTAIPAINGESMPGSITDTNYLIPYEFRVFDDSVVSIEMQRTSGDLVPFIGIADQNGNLIARGTSFDPQIASINSHPIEVGGCYYAYVSREGVSDGATTGTFALTVRGIIGEDKYEPDNLLGSVGEAEIVTGSIGSDIAQAAFSFQADIGGSFTVIATRTSGNLTPALTLEDSEGNPISSISANFVGDASNPLIFDAQAGVTYFVIVKPDSIAGLNTTGEFSLTLSRQAP